MQNRAEDVTGFLEGPDESNQLAAEEANDPIIHELDDLNASNTPPVDVSIVVREFVEKIINDSDWKPGQVTLRQYVDSPEAQLIEESSSLKDDIVNNFLEEEYGELEIAKATSDKARLYKLFKLLVGIKNDHTLISKNARLSGQDIISIINGMNMDTKQCIKEDLNKGQSSYFASILRDDLALDISYLRDSL